MKFTDEERERLEITALFAMYEEMGDHAYTVFKDMDKGALDSGLDDVYYCIILPNDESKACIHATDNDIETVLQTMDIRDEVAYIPLAVVNDGKLTVFDRRTRDMLWREVYCFMRSVKGQLDAYNEDLEPSEADILNAINAEMWCEDTTHEGEMCLAGLRVERILDKCKTPPDTTA